MSIHTMWQNKEHGTEALHRATLASPGHQKIHIARKWGFTKVNADEFENMVAEQQLIPDGLTLEDHVHGMGDGEFYVSA